MVCFNKEIPRMFLEAQLVLNKVCMDAGVLNKKSYFRLDSEDLKIDE